MGHSGPFAETEIPSTRPGPGRLHAPLSRSSASPILPFRRDVQPGQEGEDLRDLGARRFFRPPEPSEAEEILRAIGEAAKELRALRSRAPVSSSRERVVREAEVAEVERWLGGLWEELRAVRAREEALRAERSSLQEG